MTRFTRFTSLQWAAASGESEKTYAVSNVNFDVNQAVNIPNNQYIGNFQSDKDRVGGNFTQLSFTSEIRGFDATTGGYVPENALLLACGFGLTQAGSPTVTGHTYQLGDLHTVADGGVLVPAAIKHTVDGLQSAALSLAGNVMLNFRATQIPTMDFTFRGLFSAAAVEASAATFAQGELPVAVKNYGLSVTPSGSSAITSLVCREITMNLNNNINERPTVGGSGNHGFAAPRITERQPEYTALVEMDKGTFTNFETLFANRTELLWEFTHNTSGSAGTVLDVSFDCHINQHPTYQDDNGIYLVQLVMKQSIDSGATPLTLDFS